MTENILPICKFGDPVLTQIAAQVQQINEQTALLTQKMKETLHSVFNGIGLAAPQIGRSIQLAVFDMSMGENEKDFTVLINPKIIDKEGEVIDNEGCLSLPGFTLPISRHEHIVVLYHDLAGKEIKMEAEGFLARLIQHEIDHLQGKLLLDHVSRLKRQLLKREINRLKHQGLW